MNCKPYVVSDLAAKAAQVVESYRVTVKKGYKPAAALVMALGVGLLRASTYICVTGGKRIVRFGGKTISFTDAPATAGQRRFTRPADWSDAQAREFVSIIKGVK